MEKTILIKKLNQLFSTSEILHTSERKTRLYHAKEHNLEKMCKVLKAAYKSNDIAEIMNLEAYIMVEKLQTPNQTKDYTDSLTKALDQYADALRILKSIENPEEYKKPNENYTINPNRQTLPKDACQQFLSSQVSRIKNELKKDKLSEGEQSFLKLRRENMRLAEQLYMQIQKKALGLDKKQGLSL